MAKAKVHIPQRAAELTPEWFSGALDGGTVTQVRSEEIGADIGFMGEVHRCHLTWADAADDQPSSVIVKLPTDHDANFALGDALSLYEREITVYQRFRPDFGIAMPKHYHSALDPDPAPWIDRPLLFLFDHLPVRAINWLLSKMLNLAGRSKRRYLLVLEDIANARPPTQLEGGSLDDALAALEVLARFHAHNWMRTDVIDDYRRIWPLDRGARAYQANYVRNRDRFVENFADRLPDGMMNRLDTIQTRVPEINAALAAEPWTVIHGDFRLDNVLFRPDGDIVVLDFQNVGYGRPAFDVAYFITTALTAEHREDEERLLRAYHEALVDAGVADYRWEQLLADCALTKELLAHRIVGASDILHTDMDRNDGEALMDVLQFRVFDWLD